MKSNFKTFGILFAATALAVATLPADDKPAAATPAPAGNTKSSSKLDDLFPDPTIAKGKDFEIKRSQLDQVVSGFKANAAAQGQEVSAPQIAMVSRQMLDRLILINVLRNTASDAEKAKGKEEGAHRFELTKKQFPTEEALNLKLKSVGLTQDELRTRLTEEATAEGVLHAKVTVTEDQVKKFYEENPSKFEEPEMVRASHILITTSDPKTGKDLSDDDKKAKRKEIETLLKRARDGEDFTKLAKEFSDDPSAKENGGEYKFPRGQMRPEFEAAAFSMKTNQISDVVTTVYGYHIIKLSEKIPAHRIELDKVKTEVKDYLEKTEIEKMLPEYYVQVKKQAGVEILDPELKALEDAAAEALKTEATKPDSKSKDVAK